MRQSKFVEVVYMGNAEVERCCEDDLPGLDFGQDVDRDDDRAKHDFFSDRSGHVVAIALPATQTF